MKLRNANEEEPEKLLFGGRLDNSFIHSFIHSITHVPHLLITYTVLGTVLGSGEIRYSPCPWILCFDRELRKGGLNWDPKDEERAGKEQEWRCGRPIERVR